MAVDPSTGDQRVLVDRAFIEPGHIGHAAWSADGRWVAYDLGGASPLWVANGEGRPRRLTQHARAWAWAPTDPRLALIRDSRLTIIDVASGRETDLGSTASNDISGPVWSPDGTRIVFGERGGTLHSVDVANGDRSVFVRLGRGLDSVDGIEWSPDGAHIAIVVDLDIGDRRLYVANGDGSDPRVVVDDFEPGGWPVWVTDPSPETAWSPDGTTLAYPSFSAPNDRLLRIWTVSLDGSAPRQEASNLNDECCIDGGGPAWSPDGSKIAFELGTDPERQVVVNADGAGDAAFIDELTYQSWRNPGGWYFCYCYG
jgi:Tol biopolymer transport system component